MKDIAEHQDETTPTEYVISALVILSFGLLYLFINHGSDFWADKGAGEAVVAVSSPQEAELPRQTVALSVENSVPIAESGDVRRAEQQMVEAGQQLTALKQFQAEEKMVLQQENGRLLAAKEKLEAERLAHVKTIRQQLEQERLRSETATRELSEVKQLLAEEVERNKAVREQVEQALSLQAQSRQQMPEPAPTNHEGKRQVFKLPDGTEVNVPDAGFAGAVKTAMVKRSVNKPLLFDGIQFESGSSRLSASSQDQIRVVAALMNTYKDIRVLIRGHTDNTGEVKANSLLSLTRSDNMKRQLVGLGIDQNRIRIEGVGQSEPLASNTTQEGRDKNRRIELILID